MDSAWRWSDAEIVAQRPAKQPVDPWRPQAYFVERERSIAGSLVDVATVLLTNRECPFRCLMCDLWQQTTDDRVPPGAITRQIEQALAALPKASHIKLYNSGNFFDAQAIPRAEHAGIAVLCRGFQRIIVENHPRLCTDACVRFRDLADRDLEVAIGLETVHGAALAALNKRMTLGDVERAVRFLRRHAIDVRAFVLLRPPLLDEAEGIDWTLRTLRHAFDLGIDCCTVIPTRVNNGILADLARIGRVAAPRLESLEAVLEEAIGWRRGRVFADLWDLERLATCVRCGPPRIQRLRDMNWSQQVVPRVACDCGETR